MAVSVSKKDWTDGAMVFGEDISEDEAVEKLGYSQELRRSIGFIGMIGFTFNIVSSWSALTGVLIVGVQSGGPPVMIWGWIAISLGTLAVGYSMAEMCSAYPVVGGQYSWVAVLAPSRIARFMSYLCGWFTLIGMAGVGATNNFVTANFILGLANLANPDFVIERWQTTLIAYLIALIAAFVNLLGPRIFDKLSRGLLVFNIASFVAIIVTLLATNNQKRDASFVFSDFQNFTGFSDSFAAMIGLLQAGYGMCCYDSGVHLVEEMKNARRDAPRTIIMSIYIAGVTGFAFLIAVCFCIVSIDDAATTTTGVPFIQIAYDSTGSVAGTSALMSILLVIGIGAANGLMADGSRMVYALARDHGFPFSGVLRKVEPRTQVPVAAVLTTLLIQMAMNSIYFGSSTGFLTVVSIATEGYYVSYAMPLLARLLGYVSDNPRCRMMGGLYSLGRWGPLLNIIGLLFLVTMAITFNFPTLNPVTSDNMNYCSAAIGVVMLIAAVFWLTTGRKNFTGPQTGIVVDAVERPAPREIGPESVGGATEK